MISVIISSANAEQLKQVKANIEATIGVEFEIIAIDNSNGQRGICAVYNEGARRAKYDLFCFMHEDITIATDNWGNILKSTFAENAEIGLLGVCGGAYKPFTPSSWSGLGVDNEYYNFIQGYKYTANEPKHYFRNPDNTKTAKVACVDGVWLATTRTVFEQFKFDEDTFKGFHAYDLDYSIAVGRQYKVCVTYEILLTHLSEGSYSPDWINDTLKLHTKWQQLLPVNIGNFSVNECRRMEKVTFRDFVLKLVKLKLPASIAYKTLKNEKYKQLGLYRKLFFYVVKTYLFNSGS